jgi:hypothetical protein
MILLISVDVLLPDIFCRTSSSILFFPWSLGNGFPLGLFCPHPFQPCFLGSQQAVPFWGMDFLPDCSVRILIQPCFLGSQQAVPFWGMDFLDFSRTFAEL